jgi:regulator of ribonuclease activity A
MTSVFVPTADICDEEDQNGAKHFRTIALHDYGKRHRFAGKAVTVRCYEDNTEVSRSLDENGIGKILVVDGGGSCCRALFGDQLGEKALRNGWSGIIINGAVRDVAQLRSLDLGVKALGSCPRKSQKRNTGERNVVLEIFGVLIEPNQTIYADDDGVVIMPIQAAKL